MSVSETTPAWAAWHWTRRTPVRFFAEVGDLPDTGRAELLLAVLQANYLFRGTSGATLAVRPDSSILFLNRSLLLDTLSYEDFVQQLCDFTNTLAEWRRLLTDFRPAPSDRVSDPSVPDLLPMERFRI